MGLRERVQQAIAGPIGEAERVLNDALFLVAVTACGGKGGGY